MTPEEKARVIIDRQLEEAGWQVADRVIVETIFDQMQRAGSTLRKQAKNTDANMFAQNIFPAAFEKVAMQCYTDQMDAFAKLFEDSDFYKRVMQEMAKAMYANFQSTEQ